MDGAAAPTPPAPGLHDGRFTRDEWDLVSAMTLATPPPPDPTDAVADSLAAAGFGGPLFADPTLSPSNQVACASCHEADRQLTDGSPTSPEGVGKVTRNAPSLTLAAYQPWQFWDGRTDTLWSQALGPMEAPNEFGSSRLFIAHRIFDAYRGQYESLFGPMPPLDDGVRFPASGRPGDAQWSAMAPDDQAAVTKVFVNAGKAIEAFERTFRSVDSRFRRYVAGDGAALADAEKDGLLAFLRSGCAQCHWGPRMTDDAFHVLRFPSGTLTAADRGRIDGIASLGASEFGAKSLWSDAPSAARLPRAAGDWALGAFKTPALRNLALTAPYGHGGNYTLLPDVVDLIRTGGLPQTSPLAVGTTEPWLPEFSAQASGSIATFLSALDEPFAR
jgi:cytochrome c peroxidase